MKKIFLIFLLSLFVIPVPALAINLGIDRTRQAAVEAGYSDETGETTLSETIGGVVKAALSFIGVIFTALIVYAGFLWMTARGEEDKIKKAQDIIRGSIIGLVLTLGAYSITAFVVPKVLERTGAGGSSGTRTGAGQQTPGPGVCALINQNASGSQTNNTPGLSRSDCGAWCQANRPSTGSWRCVLDGRPV